MCTFLFWMVYCRVWNKCIMWFVRLVYCSKYKLRENNLPSFTLDYSDPMGTDNITTTKQIAIKSCTYCMGYTVCSRSLFDDTVTRLLANGSTAFIESFVAICWKDCDRWHICWYADDPVSTQLMQGHALLDKFWECSCQGSFCVWAQPMRDDVTL